MQVAIALFARNTALDAIGPYEVLQRVPSIDVVFVGAKRGEVRSDNGMLGLTCDATFEEVTAPDVLVFPGGIGTRTLIADESVLDWVRRVHRHTLFTTSVCTGSLVLAAAGLLTGLTAATHWRATELLESLGAVYAPQRVVEHLPQRLITDESVLDWVRQVHRHTLFTTSVCTGSLVLAAAGELTGLTAASHWRAAELLESLGAVYTPRRVVEHLPQRIVTSSGVSSGIDMALRLVELLVDREAAQAAQLMIEYDPQPPFDAGAVAKASDATRERAREYYDQRS